MSPSRHAPCPSVPNMAAEAKSDWNCTNTHCTVHVARYRCLRLAVHHTDLYGIWLRVVNRSQIRPESYQKVLRSTAQCSTIPVSPPDRVPYSTDVATSPRTVPICTEYGRCSQIRLKLYGHVLHSTSQRSAVPVSPPRRAPYLSVRNIAAEAKSDCNCTDMYCAVSLGAARCRCPHLAVHRTYLYGIWLPKPNQTVIVRTYTA
jgi:hypothetical protein